MEDDKYAQKLTNSTEAGSVLVEYVFLLGFVAIEMLVWGNKFYDSETGLGTVGTRLQGAWQRIMECVALPVP